MNGLQAADIVDMQHPVFVRLIDERGERRRPKTGCPRGHGHRPAAFSSRRAAASRAVTRGIVGIGGRRIKIAPGALTFDAGSALRGDSDVTHFVDPEKRPAGPSPASIAISEVMQTSAKSTLAQTGAQIGNRR